MFSEAQGDKMTTILSDEIEKIEVPSFSDVDEKREVVIYFKNGDIEKYKAIIEMDMFGIKPHLARFSQEY